MTRRLSPTLMRRSASVDCPIVARMRTMLETSIRSSAEDTLGDDRCAFCTLATSETPLSTTASTGTFASIGAYVPGWALAVPARHVLALAELNDDEWREFMDAATQSRRRIEKLWGSSVLFEHGAAGSGRQAACGVNHAHLHIVPLELDLRASIASVDGSVGQFEWNPCSQDRPWSKADLDYIFLSDRTGSWIAHRESIPSQVVRRAIAATLDLSDWNWRDNHRMEIVDATRRRWREFEE